MPPALRHRDFGLFWGALVLSSIGSQFTSVAMAWQIYELTNSALQIGLLGLSRAVPQMVLGLFGGLLADAVDRRQLLVITQIAQLVVSVGLVVFTAAGSISPGLLYVASVLQALASALEQPARQAIVSNIVPRESLTSAIALNSIQRTMGSIAGPSIAGVVLAFGGAAWCYSVNAASWLPMIGALFLIKSSQSAGGGRRAVSLEALQTGMTFVRSHSILLSLMTLDFFATFFGNQRALIPVFARDILEVGPSGLGILYSSMSVGSLIGALVVNRLPKRDYAGWWVMIGMTFFGLTACVFALSTSFPLTMLALAGTGLGNTVATVLRNTINQLETPDELRGRVLSVNNIFTTGGPNLGQFESGAVASIWGPQFSAFSGGLLTMLIVPALVLVPSIRNFRMGRAGAPGHATSNA